MKIDSLVKDVVSQIQSRRETVALAESCTGGLLAAHLTELAGVSSIFLGGVVCYANSVKQTLLNVDSNLIEKHGAVSKQTALAMAHGVQRQLNSTWAVAITGIAGPTGGSPTKPVGTIWISVVGPEFEVCDHHVFQGDRTAIRLASVAHALLALKRACESQRI